MKKIISLLFLPIFLLIIFTGCKNTEIKTESLIGVWLISMQDLDENTASFFQDGADTSYEFKADGSGKLTIFSVPLDFTYQLKGNKLIIEMPGEDGKNITREYKIKLQDNKLSFSTGKYNMVFKRVE